MDRTEIHQELARVRADFAGLLAQPDPEALRRRTDGTRWSNREMLFHLLFGYLVTRALLWLVRLFSRLPRWFGRGFAATLNAGTVPFHLVNYLGSVAGGRVLSLALMGRLFDHTCRWLGRRLDQESEAALGRAMLFPTRWDPYFQPQMTLLDVYHYPTLHYDHHRAQLTLPPD